MATNEAPAQQKILLASGACAGEGSTTSTGSSKSLVVTMFV
jgi:hypothetical protein